MAIVFGVITLVPIVLLVMYEGIHLVRWTRERPKAPRKPIRLRRPAPAARPAARETVRGGEPVASGYATTRLCPNCAEHMLLSSRQCRNCGSEVAPVTAPHKTSGHALRAA